MADYKDSTIHLCVHCTTQTTGKYCNTCATAEGRRKMDTENKLIHSNWVCKVCELNHYSTMVEKQFIGAVANEKS